MTFREFQDKFIAMAMVTGDENKLRFEHDTENKRYIARYNGGIFSMKESGGKITYKQNGHCMMADFV